ncbi:MAG: hypothetical protein IPG04_06700 [Polyangiaceae bacterium]|jgi:hypothetical protein|nr:hypothetical protein [Polyangiaceae bacterium]
MTLGTRSLRSALALVAASLFAAGCAQSDPIDLDGDDGPNGPQADEPAICLLHNCSDDAHCGACDGGRNTCLAEEGRCVACSADTGTGCEAGEECSSWGNCVPAGLTCPTDDHGTPTIGCQVNSDCAACDPMHQVCDTSSGQCVACTSSDTSACQSTDLCIANECSAACPSSCNMDSDCAQCDGAGFEAHACNAHRCAECSPTTPCPGGQTCSPQGVCQESCGSDGQGTCDSDADCDGCGAGNTECHTPINSSVGECGPAAAGCSQLGGNGSLVLPEPWSDYTNLCSDDGDCAGVGATLNIGEILRDLTGIDDIGDANITYGMNSCAAVNIGSTSCGVCVPCQVDSDCDPIDIDQVAGEAFGPIGSLAAALLLDLVFGPNEHQINMYCEQVAGGYGVCAPCPGFIYECGVGGGGGGGGGGSGSCDHDVCDVGSAMDGSCDSCAADVCDIDPYCCTTEWDETCVGEAEQYCGETCGGGGGAVCHDECTVGDPMDPSCNDCVDAVCTQDSYCCETEWDSVCIGYVDELCSPGC